MGSSPFSKKKKQVVFLDPLKKSSLKKIVVFLDPMQSLVFAMSLSGTLDGS